jgi:hypothetical protein
MSEGTAPHAIQALSDEAIEARKSHFEGLYKAAVVPRPRIPQSIAKAIIQVMKAVKTIEKDARNEHGKYDYASIDAVYEGVREHMAAAGLIILPMEKEVTQINEKIIKFVFGFILATETDTWEDPENQRTVYMMWMGAQTFQGAQSYADKAYQKGLFKFSTGEPEQEALPGGSMPEEKAKAGKKDKPKAALLDPEASAATATKLIHEIKAVVNFDGTAHNDFAEKYGSVIDALQPVDAEAVRTAFKAQRVKK